MSFFLYKYKYLIILGLICLGFLALESFHAKQYGFSEEDELKSIMTSVGFNPENIDFITKKSTFYQEDFLGSNNLKSTIHNSILHESGNCILYNITLHLWFKIFDFSLYSGRMFSVLFGIGVIIVSFFLSDSLFDNKKISILSSLLIACNQNIFAYSISLRTYSMAIFFSLLATLLFVKWLRSLELAADKKTVTKTSISYSIIAGLSLLTHYFCIYILMIHFLFLIPLFFKNSTKNKVAIFLPYVIISGILATWMLAGGYEGSKGMASGNDWHLKYAKSANKLSTMTQITSLENTIDYLKTTALEWTYNGRYWHYFSFNIKMRYIIFLFAIPTFFLVTSLYYLWKKKRNVLYLLCSLAIVGPVFCIYLAFNSGHTVSFSSRYIVICIPYFAIILAYGIYQIQTKSGIWKIASIVLFALFSLNILVQSKLSFDETAEQLQPHLLQMNLAVQEKLDRTKNISSKTIEFPYPWLAVKFNFNFIPTQMKIPQKINTQIEPNKIYLYDAVSKKRTVLYEFPKDFNATPN